MTDLKPLKRNKNLVWLSRDHHDGLLLVWKIRNGLSNAIDAKRISDYVVYAFAEELEPHFRSEEDLIFIELDKKDALRLKAEDQHAELRKLLGEIKAQPLEAVQTLNAFANLLEEHIRFEERILFPHVQEVLTTDMLEAIGARLEEGHLLNECSAWSDEFWKKNPDGN